MLASSQDTSTRTVTECLYLIIACICSNSGACRMPMPDVAVMLQPEYVAAMSVLAVKGRV